MHGESDLRSKISSLMDFLKLGSVKHTLKLACGSLLHTFENVTVCVCRESDRTVAQALGNDLQVFVGS